MNKIVQIYNINIYNTNKRIKKWKVQSDLQVIQKERVSDEVTNNSQWAYCEKDELALYIINIIYEYAYYI